MATPSRRNRQITRALELIVLIGENRVGMSLVDLAGAVEITTRTVRRDLEAIEAAGFSLYDEVDEQGVCRWKLLSAGFTPARRAA